MLKFKSEHITALFSKDKKSKKENKKIIYK